jgi:hypothetical protein
MNMSNYPKYVDDLGHGQVAAQPPGYINNATSYCFGFDIDAAKAQKTVDYFLNEPAAGAVTYSVLGSTAMVTFMRAEKLLCAQVVGWLPDSECAFWLPLVGRTGKDGPERFVMWNPYLAIDNSEGMVTAREAWGWRKFLGTVTMPDPGSPARFEATGRIYKTFNQDTEGVDETLVVLQQDAVLQLGEAVWLDLGAAFKAFMSMWTGGQPVLKAHGFELMIDLWKHFGGGRRNVPMVNLKQFRDAADFTRACYQAIIESSCTVVGEAKGGPLLGKYRLHITECASHRINEDLGIAQDAESTFGAWVTMSFTADAGVEVWRAGS